MKENILYLECRGCYFFKNDRINNISDVGNYRVGAYTHRIQAKDGRAYILEFKWFSNLDQSKFFAFGYPFLR